MPSDVNGALQKATRTFSTFSLGQKAVTVLAVAGVLLGGFLVARWAATPTYAPLFSNLSSQDAAAIVEELEAEGRTYELANGGSTILVPRETVYETRLKMSGAGLPTGDGGTGYALLDQQGVTASQFQQKVAFQRALEGELTKTIGTIDGVETAVVHLAIPEKDVFTKESDKPTASVLVQVARGSELSSEQVQAIVNLVSSSVEGLAPDKVTVADSRGTVLSASEEGAPGALADNRAKATRAFEDRMSGDVQAMLDRIVGAGGSSVTITADLDFDRTDTVSERYENAEDAPVQDEKRTEEEYTGGGALVGGQLGTGVFGPDNQAVPNGAEGQQNQYSKVDSTVNRALDKVVEQRQTAPGAVRKLSVAVVLDQRRAGTLDPGQVEELVSAAVGIDPERGDLITVQRAPFDTSAADAAAAELEAANKAEAAAARSQTLKTTALAGLVGIVLLYAMLSGRRRRRSAELSDEDRLQIEQLQEALELANARQEMAEVTAARALPALEPAPVDPQAELAMAARDEIGELVKAQPEEVAQLLRSWLADRRS